MKLHLKQTVKYHFSVPIYLHMVYSHMEERILYGMLYLDPCKVNEMHDMRNNLRQSIYFICYTK